ncbi:MAG: hypothetical protein ABI959_10945 [Candidatus Dormiibacterota bacterium]
MTENPSARPVWIGLVEAAPIKADDPKWTENFRHSSGGVTTGVAFAVDAAEFRDQIAEALAEVGASPTSFEDVETMVARLASQPDANPQHELIEELRLTGLAQLGTFHLYGPQEFESNSDWLEAAADWDDLTELQREVMRQLAGMLRSLDLPFLDFVDLDTPDGSTVVRLSHKDEDGLDLEVRIAADDEVVVDYGPGHVHFPGGHAQQGLDDVLDFIFAAFQGGVMVEVWKEGDSIDRVRTSIQAEGGGWRTYSSTTSTDSATFDDEPSNRRLLGFAQKEKGPDQ